MAERFALALEKFAAERSGFRCAAGKISGKSKINADTFRRWMQSGTPQWIGENRPKNSPHTES